MYISSYIIGIGVECMKKNIYYLLIFCFIFLTGCIKMNEPQQDTPRTEELEIANDQIDEKLYEVESNLASDLEQQESIVPISYGKVTGDNLTVATEFADDLLMERFDKLEQAYNYSTDMEQKMQLLDTKKTVIYHNKMVGYVSSVKSAYVLSYGIYQYVYVPVECLTTNYNVQIVFDSNHNILGFSYMEYKEKNTRNKVQNTEYATETNYFFESNGYILSGTLTTPRYGTNFPVVILVQGAGPSDRDESIYLNKPFEDLAFGLAEQGIATFRFDKRSYTYYEEFQSDQTITLEEEIVEDVVSAAQWIGEISSIDSERIFVLGHSLGGYVIPRIAEQLEQVAGYIFMAVPATHLRNYILNVYESIALEDGIKTEEEQENLNKIQEEITILGTPEDIPEETAVFGYYKNYWIDMYEYNPLGMAANIKVPILMLQGGRDYQVSMTQFDIWKNKFLYYSNWTFKTYETLNHFMMEGTGIFYTYEYQTQSKMSSQVVDDIAIFVMSEE